MESHRIAVLLAALAAPACAATCESLAALSLPAVTVTSAAGVPAGSFTPPGGKEIPNLPAFCRVNGSIQPSSDSDIQFEVWLPAAGWNGRYLGTGNGGFAGAIGYGGLAEAVRAGYATSGTDTGHHAAGGIDAGWALGHPEKIVDYGHRAIHETAVLAKALVKAYYGDAPRRSYFNSCSNGGRQALMEAQRYPEDYDGIIAGAPANYFTHLLAAFVWDQQALLQKPGSYIPASKLPAIEAAVMAACDAKDGVKDGVIENPAVCRVDVAKLRCAGAETDQCLTAPQVATLKKIYSGPPGFPGYPPGGEAHAAGWGPWVTGKEPTKSATFGFGTQFFANMVFSDAKWDFHTFQPARDTRAADERMGPIVNSIDPDLSKFKSRGGKLILYHGWSDAAIPATNSVNYYRSVAAKLGPKETESFVRLYMAPGMQHCGSGDGPNTFGQAGPPKGDARTNIGKALEEWVESGSAPGPIVARNGSRSRPLCPYPQVAVYQGSGSTDDEANFRCAAK